MSIDIYKLSQTSKYAYDNGAGYGNDLDEHFDLYAGPCFGRENHLSICNGQSRTIAVHWIGSEKKELWQGQINNELDFQTLITLLDDYEREYRAVNKLHPTHNYEEDVIREQHLAYERKEQFFEAIRRSDLEQAVSLLPLDRDYLSVSQAFQAFELARKSGNTRMVRLLADFGFDVNSSQFVTDPVTPLAEALRNDDAETAGILREAGGVTYWRQAVFAKAYLFAAQAHNGQLLPGSDQPYIVHVTQVAMEIMAVHQFERQFDCELSLQCALLHDVIEDTKVTYEQVEGIFGKRVADGVLALSKDKNLEKTAQMEDSLDRIRQQPPEVWMVKLADRITNLQPPFPSYWDKEKINRYRREAITIYKALKDASPYLARRLNMMISQCPSAGRRGMIPGGTV